MLIGFFAKNLKGIWQWWILLIAALALVSTNLVYTQPVGTSKVALVNNTFDVRTSFPQELGEFLPRSFKELLLPPSPNAADVRKGNGEIIVHTKQSSLRHHFVIKAQTSIVVSFNSFYFPGWRVQENGRDIDIIKDNPYGLILFILPAGDHAIDIFFGSTLVRNIGMAIAFLSLFILILVMLYNNPRKKHV